MPDAEPASASAIDRAAIDSWATRLGAIAVLQLAAQQASATPFYQAVIQIALITLVVTATAPVLSSIPSALADVSPRRPRTWIIPAILFATAVMPVALGLPHLAAAPVEWLFSPRTVAWLVLAAVLFGLGKAIKLGALAGWRAVVAWSRRRRAAPGG
ncbi:hypothetical protein [Paracoccus sanguinis]|uniref:Uncharacterized protein n=1 Tax=Paracoccus sanguinis TaxID=1545044 RepID=A0A1H2TBR3_9RHOB|nr:hypothetical protein [Paracoccus sanguinis]SDW41197.1 hypothetical protein SAMN05444276_101902 [Paracoccus sanguinis]